MRARWEWFPDQRAQALQQSSTWLTNLNLFQMDELFHSEDICQVLYFGSFH
ncbi:hypothetical protein PT2222_30083 [Paraburkholderia tropica]